MRPVIFFLVLSLNVVLINARYSDKATLGARLIRSLSTRSKINEPKGQDSLSQDMKKQMKRIDALEDIFIGSSGSAGKKKKTVHSTRRSSVDDTKELDKELSKINDDDDDEEEKTLKIRSEEDSRVRRDVKDKSKNKESKKSSGKHDSVLGKELSDDHRTGYSDKDDSNSKKSIIPGNRNMKEDVTKSEGDLMGGAGAMNDDPESDDDVSNHGDDESSEKDLGEFSKKDDVSNHGDDDEDSSEEDVGESSKKDDASNHGDDDEARSEKDDEESSKKDDVSNHGDEESDEDSSEEDVGESSKKDDVSNHGDDEESSEKDVGEFSKKDDVDDKSEKYEKIENDDQSESDDSESKEVENSENSDDESENNDESKNDNDKTDDGDVKKSTTDNYEKSDGETADKKSGGLTDNKDTADKDVSCRTECSPAMDYDTCAVPRCDYKIGTIRDLCQYLCHHQKVHCEEVCE